MRRTDLALRALRVLEATGTPLQARELADRLHSTPQFIPQVLNPLVRAGWVDSGPGRNGGYRLADDLAGRSVLDLIELIEGPTDNGRCVLSGGPCPGESTCALHDAWGDARRALLTRLATGRISNHTPTTPERGTS